MKSNLSVTQAALNACLLSLRHALAFNMLRACIPCAADLFVALQEMRLLAQLLGARARQAAARASASPEEQRTGQLHMECMHAAC